MHLEALKPRQKGSAQATAPKAKAEDGGSERALVEARVSLNGAFFRMDHHPMEVRSTCCCWRNISFFTFPAAWCSMQRPSPQSPMSFPVNCFDLQC